MTRDGGDDDYDVGYAKPPVHSRFQKGVSGNRAGRPKRPKSDRELLMAELERKAEVSEGGKKIRLSRRQLTFRQMVNKAAAGHPKDLLAFLKYLGPDPKAKPEHDGDAAASDADAETYESVMRRLKGEKP